MSLVNNMLRDLAARQQADDSTTAENDVLLQQSSLLRRTRYTWMPSVLIFVAVILLALVAQWFLQKDNEQEFPQAKTSSETHEVAPAQRASVLEEPTKENIQKEAVPKAFALKEPLSKERAPIDTVAAEPHNAKQQEDIYRLLQQAERALTLDRLTAPIEDNAYRYYQQILRLTPDNQPAVEGMQRIAQRYLELAQDAYQGGETTRVETLLQRAEWVAPDYAAIAEFRAQLQQVISSPQSVTAEESIVSSNAEVAAVPVKTLPVAEAKPSDLDIKPSPAWQDQQMIDQADALIEQGHHDAAVLALQQFIAQHPQPVKSAVHLFDLYVQQNNHEAARLLLQQADAYLSATDYTRLTAQLLTAQGQHAAALAVLEKDIEQARQDETYRALLAALYHKAARYQESANHYRRLLANFGEKPAYWLGLALALDALQENTSALEAYQRIGLQDAQPQVKDYVAQRIAALSH
ncbi:MAG TPA: tetratricopeptide repeat protein [Cellvibrio sp.]|nr:tetratricopeptide repeat protein [Cellvibrio sp.]